MKNVRLIYILVLFGMVAGGGIMPSVLAGRQTDLYNSLLYQNTFTGNWSIDSSRFKNYGTTNSGTLKIQNGTCVAGGCLNLTGNQWFLVPAINSYNISNGNFTVGCWQKFDLSAPNMFAFSHTQGVNLDDWVLEHNAGTARVDIYNHASLDDSLQGLTIDGLVGRWYFTAFTWLGTTRELILYINDTVETSKSIGFDMAQGASSLQFSGRYNGTGGLLYTGLIDECFWANKTWIQDEIEFYYNLTKGGSSLTLEEAFLTFPANSTNASLAKRFKPSKFSFNGSDDIGLSTFTFGWNDTGTWQNVSNFTLATQTVTALNYTFNQTVTAKRNTVVGYHACINDTTNQKACSGIQTFTVTDSPPVFTLAINNSVLKINKVIQLSALANDSDNLSMVIASWNGTSGVWTNVSNISLANYPFANNYTVNLTIGLVRGNTIGWLFYANDSVEGSNFTASAVNTFTVVDTSGTIRLGLNLSTINLNNIINISGNITEEDSDVAYGMTAHNQSGTMINYTFAGSGTRFNFSQNVSITVAHAVINFTVFYNDTSGNTIQNSTLLSVVNNLPVVDSAAINNTSPLDSDDLDCVNGTLSDADSDTVSLLYNWTKNGIDQAISSKTLSDTLTSVNDVWICRITPFDGIGNGTTKTSSSVSIGTGAVAPILNATNATPLTAETLKGQWLNLSVNFTDANSIDIHTSYFCKTDSANSGGCLEGTFCSSSINVSASGFLSCRVNITNTSVFPLGVNTFYTFVVDNSSLVSASKSNTFTVQDITPPAFPFYQLQYTTLNDASGNTNNFTANMVDNVSNVQTMTFWINNTLNATRSFTLTPNLSVNVTYAIFESLETLKRGTYNITKVIVTDNSSNSKDYNFSNITFVVSEAPSGGGQTGGGGGGTTIVQIASNKTTIISEILCNFNGICEIETGEDFVNCGNEKSPFDRNGDCGFEVGLLGSTIKNQLKYGLVSKILFGIFIASILVLVFLPKERLDRIKRRFKKYRTQEG